MSTIRVSIGVVIGGVTIRHNTANKLSTILWLTGHTVPIGAHQAGVASGSKRTPICGVISWSGTPDRKSLPTEWMYCTAEGCDYRTKVNSCLVRHVKSRHNSDNHEVSTDCMQRYDCTDCGKSYARKRTLNEHRLVVHTGAVEYRCEQCGKQYTCLSALKTHVWQTHYKVFVCDYDQCDRQFVSDLDRRVHVLDVHSLPTPPPPPTITTIDSMLSVVNVESDLIDNTTTPLIVTQITVPQKPFDIPVYPLVDGLGYRCGHEGCTYSAKREIFVVRHQITHSTDRPFRCRLQGCRQRFKTESTLQSHQLNVHPEEFPDRQWIACLVTDCDYRTKVGHQMTKHVKSHTLRYACDECHKTYVTKLSLTA